MIFTVPFCTQCGSQVGSMDVFCAKCGSRQAAVPPPRTGRPGHRDLLKELSPRTAGILCYVPLMGWLASIVILASPQFKDKRPVRFHAFQGLYLFVAWLIVDSIHLGGPHGGDFVRSPLHGVLLFAWIFMLIKTSHDQIYHLPLLGELAERSVSEQH